MAVPHNIAHSLVEEEMVKEFVQEVVHHDMQCTRARATLELLELSLYNKLAQCPAAHTRAFLQIEDTFGCHPLFISFMVMETGTFMLAMDNGKKDLPQSTHVVQKLHTVE